MISNIAKINYLASRSIISQALRFNFATGQKLLHATKSLISLNSEQLDQLCQTTLENYQRKPRADRKQKEKHNNNHQSKKSPSKNDAGWVDTDSKSDSKQELVKFLYDTVSQPKLGFLKGDIHSQFIFKLNQSLMQKNKKILTKQVKPDELKKIFNQITELKKFRLPKFGIKNSSLQDQSNIYQRQLILEQVSNEQSNQKYDDLLDSLEKLGKIHLKGVFREYLNYWFIPLCQAIREEQNKCRDEKHLEGDRKKYAEAFLKLSPQKLSLVCLSELLKEITAILYKDFVRQSVSNQSQLEQNNQPELQDYDSIRYSTLCVSFAKWVSIQCHFQQEERKFKQAMKVYDSIRQVKANMKNNQSQQIENLIQQRAQQKIKQKISHQLSHEEVDFSSFQNPFGEAQQSAQTIQSSHTMTQEQVQEKIDKKTLEDKFNQTKRLYGFKYVPPDGRKAFLQQMINKFTREYYRFKSDMTEEVQQLIGKALIYMMKQIIKTKNRSGQSVPLLSLEHKYFKRNGQVKYDKRLKVNQHFLNTILPAIQKDGDLFLHLDRSVPTIIEPLPWVQYEIGGYYLHPSTIMRFSQCRIQERLVKYSDMSRVFNVLNYLGKIPWQINKKVLAVVQAIWTEGGQIGQIPKRYSQMMSTYLVNLKLQTNYLKQRQLQKKIQKLRDQHSLRSDFNLKLNLAQSFSKVDRFYYPHNLDFRGRVYPIPPHLNHIGNDLSRGLLLFADGVKLGESGLRWLKIHCANLMGKDKATLFQKVEFIQSNLGLIQAISEDPLKNRQWTHYQDCWQALAAIIQLNTALKHKNPEEYVSCMHVHQDGSCNGLQHYAALGRDTEGAYQVNLGPNDRPGDVYTHVAKMVIGMVDNDIANPQSPHHNLAKKLNGQIKRKTIKQTVMTSVYGVTFIGAREQIHRQLKDQHFLKDDDEQYAASIYLAKYTLNAISNLFSSAHLIKKWLIDCAGLVGKEGNPVGWITPMGLPVVQPYRKFSKIDQVNTILYALKLAKESQNLSVNKSKQKSAFPPNFVHSLDSTHMMYTAQKCKIEGITFAAVHDSYWTHAGTVQRMNQLLREQFIRLHSQPLLQNLRASFERRYPMIDFPEIPKRGDFDLSKIQESKYFFA